MAKIEKTICDSPECGKDITEGEGRNTRYLAYSELIKVRTGSTPVNTAGPLAASHFCNARCAAAFFIDLSKAERPEG